MSNVEVMNSACRELLCRTVYFKKDRAQRFYPSTFCGSIFDILRFAVPTICSFTRVFRCQNLATRLPDTRNLTPDTYTLRPGALVAELLQLAQFRTMTLTSIYHT